MAASVGPSQDCRRLTRCQRSPARDQCSDRVITPDGERPSALGLFRPGIVELWVRLVTTVSNPSLKVGGIGASGASAGGKLAYASATILTAWHSSEFITCSPPSQVLVATVTRGLSAVAPGRSKSSLMSW